MLDELGLPQPPRRLCQSRAEWEQPYPFPYYIKTAYGTAGSGVWHIDHEVTQAAVIDLLAARGLFNEHTPSLVQDVAPGVLEVVQSVLQTSWCGSHFNRHHRSWLIHLNGGVQSHSLMAVLLGMAARGGTRFDLLRELMRALFRGGRYAHSQEECIRMREDALSLIALLVVFVQLVVTPRLGRCIATTAVSNYALTEGTARLILERNDLSLLDSSGGLTKGRESI